MTLRPSRAAAMLLFAAGSALLAAPGRAQTSGVAMTCTNPASGASWTISIDYDKRTVDSNPAQISDSEISWRGAQDGGTYTLDRKSGNLTMVAASSTGGYFVYDHCRLEK